MNANQGLFVAGQTYPDVLVCFSQPNGALMDMAARHARYQAAMQRMGHQLWWTRRIELRWTVGAYNFEEVCADTWPHQEHLAPIEIGRCMFSTWKKSLVDWKIATRKHKYFGYGIAKSTRGIWYATIVVAN